MNSRKIFCQKLQKEGEGLSNPPMPGELGEKIYQSISKEAWEGWMRHQTMIINENRLNLADSAARAFLRRQLEDYFFADEKE